MDNLPTQSSSDLFRLKDIYFEMMTPPAQHQFLHHILEKQRDYFHQLSPVTLLRWGAHLCKSLDLNQLVLFRESCLAIHRLDMTSLPKSLPHCEIEMLGMILFPDLSVVDGNPDLELQTKLLRQELQRVRLELGRLLEDYSITGKPTESMIRDLVNGEIG